MLLPHSRHQSCQLNCWSTLMLWSLHDTDDAYTTDLLVTCLVIYKTIL